MRAGEERQCCDFGVTRNVNPGAGNVDFLSPSGRIRSDPRISCCNAIKGESRMCRRLIAAVLCLFLSPLPAFCAPGDHAGQINALVPAASRNSAPAKVRDDLQWNDLLQTGSSGRLRAGLADGSILSLGSSSELRVVQHDAASQQTSLEVNFGKVRSKVVKITQPNEIGRAHV